MSRTSNMPLKAATLGAAMAGAVFCLSNLAFAGPGKVVAGTLTCKSGGGVGLIVGSKQNMRCRFHPAGGGRSQAYHGSITKIGLDVGIKGPSVLVWTVLSATSTLPRHALEGSYGGVSADASIGIGAGANALVGGSSRSVVLQPLSVQGETGLNVAIGVSGLTLDRI